MYSRRLLIFYGGWMAVLGVAFYVIPTGQELVWTAIGVSSAAAVAAGAIRNRPRRRLPWLLMSGGVLLFAAGDVTYFLLTQVLGQENPFPSAADVFYLATFVFLAAGLLSLARSGFPRRPWASLVDTLILTTGAALLAWIFLVNPYVESADLTLPEKLVSISYPLGDVLILATIARLLVAARRGVSVVLLALGGAGLLVADVLYGLNQLGGAWQIGGPVDLGWILFYGLWGAAALHPSMVRLTEPLIVRQSEVTARRLAVLTLSSLIPPAVLLIEGITGDVNHAAVIALVSAAMFMLVLFRLAGVVASHRRALVRERGLRDAGAALVVATEVGEVRETVHWAVARMLPPHTPNRVLLVVNEAAGGPEASQLCYTRELEPRLAAQFGGFEVALRCPLTWDDRAAGGAGLGALFVAAAEVTLASLHKTVEVLAAQAALALQRIALNSELSRRHSEEYFRTLVQNAADVILIVDDRNQIKYASPSARTVFGRVSLTGMALSDLIRIDDPASDMRMPEMVPGGGTADWTVLRPDNAAVHVEVSSRDLRHDPTVGGLVVTLRDVTERRRLEHELTHRAFHDALTGLANRVLFQERVQHAVSQARLGRGVAGVLFLDLDDFKVVNDTLGHEMGDLLLVAVSQRITGTLPPTGTAARLGGDEFALLIEDAADPTDLERIAERLVAILAEPFRIRGSVVSGAASIGVATTADCADGRDLLRLADLALYVAKGAGKGQWRRYQAAQHTAFLARMELRGALNQAVTGGGFALRYQPIVALATGATVGFEALLRWDHPTRGLLPPDQFIGVAEETGLIVPIGNWVLENALAGAAQWQRLPVTGQAPYVSVNMSVRQFRPRSPVEKIRWELALVELPPQCLMVEITESMLLRDDEQVWSDLAAFREMGVRVAIDDFGTGYSSLAYLRHVPIDVIKIDRTFINSASTSVQQRAVVESVVRLAQTLGLEVIAEGIEQPRDRDLLTAIGCRFGQGYLFSPPLSHGDATRWLLGADVAA